MSQDGQNCELKDNDNIVVSTGDGLKRSRLPESQNAMPLVTAQEMTISEDI